MIKNHLLNILANSIERDVAGIHFTPTGNEILIQYRTGDCLSPQGIMKQKRYEQLLAYVRLQASLELESPSRVQSGNFIIKNKRSFYHCHVSIFPKVGFQSLSIRVIDHGLPLKIDDLPFIKENVKPLKDIGNNQAGLVVIGGTTSSEKSTTAYALIDELKAQGKSVLINKEPNSYFCDVVTKRILEHDPDVIMLGEIRCPHSAKKAMEFAMAGHLVIATLSVTDNPSAVYKLLDLGITLSELDQLVVALVNQRFIEVGNRQKALMEICMGDHLENLMEQVEDGKVWSIPYRTLNEEFSEWKSKVKKRSKGSD